MKFIHLFFILFFFCSPLSAEYYQYKDKDGVVHFTDNLGDVPEEQRAEVNRYEEIEEKPNKKISKSNQDGDGKEIETLLHLQALNREKEFLDKDYERLVTKKQRLKKEKASLATSVEVTAYQNKIKRLNQEIFEFEERRKKFEKKAKEFNTKTVQ